MVTTPWKFASKGAVLFCLSTAMLLAQQGQHIFDGTWQMDAAQSKVNDGRAVTVTITTLDKGVKVAFKTHLSNGTDTQSEFTSLLDGKPCDFVEGNHKSQLTAWYNGPTLNADKESGPPEDVSSMWKFEMGSSKDTMTLTINHYTPAAADETLVFKKKGS
jgi:hypothetical protein